MSNCIFYNLNNQVTAAGSLGTATIRDEKLVRFVIENAQSSNTVIVRGQITGQTDWDTLGTITGTAKVNINVATYDTIEVSVTVYAPTTNYIKVLASSFNDAGGSTSIDAPTGGTVTSDIINFTSSDSSVIITADPGTNTIDFVAVGGGGSTSKYVKTVLLGDWVGPSAGEYSLSIPFSLHAKVNPVVTCLEASGSDFELIDAAVVLTGNDIKIFVLSTPDTRFVGKIFID